MDERQNGSEFGVLLPGVVLQSHVNPTRDRVAGRFVPIRQLEGDA
jgi:hypothetical protein